MKLDYGASSFVIIGGWNPNIVNDTWIRQNLLDNPSEQVNVGLKGTAGFPAGNLAAAIPAAIFKNVGLAVSGERLELSLIHSNDFTDIVNCVRKLYACQSNTLISGYGINLVYIGNMVSNKLIDFFKSDPLSQAFNQSHRYALTLNEINTNIAIELNRTGDRSAIAFNFHFSITDFSMLIQRMEEYPIDVLNSMAVEFISSQYGIVLEY